LTQGDYVASSIANTLQKWTRSVTPHGQCQAAFGVGCAASLSQSLLGRAPGQHISFSFGLPAGPLQSGHGASFAATWKKHLPFGMPWG